ncbi:MAG: hypothetical protein ACXU86_08895 [Archangium sp.]
MSRAAPTAVGSSGEATPGLGGCFSYDELMDEHRAGRYPGVPIVSAAGRPNILLGVAPEQFHSLEDAARQVSTGFTLLGSRVSGPRVRQRLLHPALAATLPLQSDGRLASVTYPAVRGVRIDKTAIKELGADSPHTSDLSIVLVDAVRGGSELHALAIELEERFKRAGWRFPVKFFASLGGQSHATEASLQAVGARFLASCLPPGVSFTFEELCAAWSELYCPVNIRHAPGAR